MKKLIPLVIFIFLLSSISSGQKLSAVDTSKYTINLPEYWKAGNKIWKILTDKLPLVCEELNDKELCGDNCHPKYSIEFEMSEPIVFDYYPYHISSTSTKETWGFVTLFGFSSSLLLLNEKNELLTRFILVDTNEVWKISHKAELAAATPRPPMKVYALDAGYQPSENELTTINQMYNSRSGAVGQTPYSYINSNKGGLSPMQTDMLSIVDQKIKSW